MENKSILDTQEKFAGKYQIFELIGRGGTGSVYRAEHLYLRREVAIKVLNAEQTEKDDAGFAARFLREAQAMSRLAHPNLGAIYDFGSDNGRLYLVMEFIRGESLAALLKRSGPLSQNRTAALFAQICSAVDHAHKVGVVHRDLKPENILIRRKEDGREWITVLDFGLAKLPGGGEKTNLFHTQTGIVLGTPYYMAPEQIQGKAVDQRADVYSLGAILYQMVTGKLPFDGTSLVSVLMQHINELPESPAKCCPEINISSALERLILSALDKNPDKRPRSAAEFGAELLALVKNSSRKSLSTKRAAVAASVKKSIGKSLRTSAICFAASFAFVFGLILASQIRNLSAETLTNTDKQEAEKETSAQPAEETPPPAEANVPAEAAPETEQIGDKPEKQEQQSRPLEAEASNTEATSGGENSAAVQPKQTAPARQSAKRQERRQAAARQTAPSVRVLVPLNGGTPFVGFETGVEESETTDIHIQGGSSGILADDLGGF